MKIIRLILVFVFCSLMALHAQVPGTLSYQGILMQNDGITPIADGAHSIAFNFYTTSSGGSALFSRTISVTTTKGLYTCIIGSNTAPNAPFTITEMNQIGSQQIFIAITVDGGGELSPRAQLTTTPYSFRAESVTNTTNPTGGNVTFWGANNSVSSDAGLSWDNSNKRLGIGTSTPTEELEIASSGYPYISLNKLSNAQESGIVFKTGGVVKGYLYTKNDATSALTFYSEETGGDGSTPRLRMPFNNKNIYLAESGGNVSIGTNSPAAKLHVAGDVNIQGELHNTAVSPTSNMLAIAYGAVNSDGTISNSGSGNWTVTYYSCTIILPQAYYEINIGQTVNKPTHVVLSSIEGLGYTSPRWVKTLLCPGSNANNLQISTYDTNPSLAQRAFSFVVFKP